MESGRGGEGERERVALTWEVRSESQWLTQCRGIAAAAVSQDHPEHFVDTSSEIAA